MQSLLAVRGVQKTFEGPAGRISVLKDASFDVGHGELLAIVGESGSGKSTLLHVLGTLEKPDAGEATLDGTNLFDLSPNQAAVLRNRSLGFIYQAHHLIPELTAMENVLLPLQVRGEKHEHAVQRAESLLARLGLADRMAHRPARLSGGEAQRVAVARALVGRPRLLLADEPTGNLDEKTADEVFDALRQMCREEEASVVIVTHSRRLARSCDRVLRLHGGRMESFSS
jgi:lipoprotein-releasing system ATP-binding protein